jgi:hypothetical protein
VRVGPPAQLKVYVCCACWAHQQSAVWLVINHAQPLCPACFLSLRQVVMVFSGQGMGNFVNGVVILLLMLMYNMTGACSTAVRVDVT